MKGIACYIRDTYNLLVDKLGELLNSSLTINNDINRLSSKLDVYHSSECIEYNVFPESLGLISYNLSGLQTEVGCFGSKVDGFNPPAGAPIGSFNIEGNLRANEIYTISNSNLSLYDWTDRLNPVFISDSTVTGVVNAGSEFLREVFSDQFSGEVYLVTQEGFGSGDNPSYRLYTVDPTNGVATFIGDLPASVNSQDPHMTKTLDGRFLILLNNSGVGEVRELDVNTMTLGSVIFNPSINISYEGIITNPVTNELLIVNLPTTTSNGLKTYTVDGVLINECNANRQQRRYAYVYEDLSIETKKAKRIYHKNLLTNEITFQDHDFETGELLNIDSNSEITICSEGQLNVLQSEFNQTQTILNDILTELQNPIYVRTYEDCDADGKNIIITDKLDKDLNVISTVSKIVGETCKCDCETNTACILMDGFDSSRGLLTPGNTSTFEILLDGVNQATVVHDYTTTADGVTVSSWYDPVITAINAVPGWSISLETDVNATDGGKVTWRVEHRGNTASELVINKNNGADILTLSSDGMGVIVGSTNWGVDSFPFRDCS